MTPTVVEEEQHDNLDDAIPDASDEDDNVQGAGALPDAETDNVEMSEKSEPIKINLVSIFFSN